MSLRDRSKEYVVSLIEYCSSEVGLAMFNRSSGEIYLCHIIERLTYLKTLSTVQRFTPVQIIYSSNHEGSLLVRKLRKELRGTLMKGVKRSQFDETSGYEIYKKRNNKDTYNPDQKFIAYAALNALLNELELHHETPLAHSALNIKWHELEGLLVIESQTIKELEILGSKEEDQHCLADNFDCATKGGSRMLRANLLQPLSDSTRIQERQELLAKLL